uniref:transposase n=1 Tax=Alicyclobacillus tolerans TaxID=90970 RepID=UPI003556939C
MRYIRLKNEHNLTSKQKDRLQVLRHLNLKTARAYQMMLTFKELWIQPKFLAKAFLDKWYFWATHSRLKAND